MPNPPSEHHLNSVAALVLFFEKPEQTLQCINSLQLQNIPVYLLNNGSSAKSTEQVQAFCDRYNDVHILHSDVNRGVAGGRNRLIEATHQEWMLFLDSDIMILTPDLLDRFRDQVRRNPDADVISGAIYNIHYQSWQQQAYQEDFGTYGPRKVLEKFPGGASFIRRQLFSTVGLYNDSMFVGLEDFEFLARAKQIGYHITAVLADDLRFMHEHRYMDTREDRKATEIRYSAKGNLHSQTILQQSGYRLDVETIQRWLDSQKQVMLEPPPTSPAQPQRCVVRMTPPDLAERLHGLCARYPTVDEIAFQDMPEATWPDAMRSLLNTLRAGELRTCLTVDISRLTAVAAVVPGLDSLDLTSHGGEAAARRWEGAAARLDRLVQGVPALGCTFVVAQRWHLEALDRLLCLGSAAGATQIRVELWAGGDGELAAWRETLRGLVAALREQRNLPPITVLARGRENLCRSYDQIAVLTQDGLLGGCPRGVLLDRPIDVEVDDDPFNTADMMRLRKNQRLGMPAHPECIHCSRNGRTELL